MPNVNDRFKVTISLDIEKFQEDGKTTKPFAVTTQEYSGLDYVQLVDFQEKAFGALVPALLAMGRVDADAIISASIAEVPKEVKKYK